MSITRPIILAITTGEPAGIGPELTLQALTTLQNKMPDVAGSNISTKEIFSSAKFCILGDPGLLSARARMLGLEDSWHRLLSSTRVQVVSHALARPVVAGQLDPANGRYVLSLLDDAIDGAMAGSYDAIVTAPLQKSTINDSGVCFIGHTEYLAERTQTCKVVMMLAGGGIRVALATTHLPLAKVPDAIHYHSLLATLKIIDLSLRRDFGITAPHILVTGLNPHAGESGYLGREEIDIITPAIDNARALGIRATGPYPADTLFQPRHLEGADCVLAMYHDQGLPVLKYKSFGVGVNITLGLPIIRTSVDHGTALDLSGTGRADSGSLIEAMRIAILMAKNRTAISMRPIPIH
ncbi:4-hydroxythreonine-4-phosphate dehydrogenase PdxA [Candidatus Pandoraea novymonadis]|uniref:4-hydroxythreonine-4-phosphate dehydrogenase n=1 Tax=Candidatus Pandoraea novymonadis TaxID=1808959 RepID=A0ABX5FD56_9BURK|nr:4-hydroxythreonine-4-phosphate dehydrogenase PdxA [Candidatus Pandoraea novymonadis]PSB91713.1 4-hydroxythreonine-4-phosphate dehydrogenase [Candidatus Pandoraea novymonadis]